LDISSDAVWITVSRSFTNVLNYNWDFQSFRPKKKRVTTGRNQYQQWVIQLPLYDSICLDHKPLLEGLNLDQRPTTLLKSKKNEEIQLIHSALLQLLQTKERSNLDGSERCRAEQMIKAKIIAERSMDHILFLENSSYASECSSHQIQSQKIQKTSQVSQLRHFNTRFCSLPEIKNPAQHIESKSNALKTTIVKQRMCYECSKCISIFTDSNGAEQHFNHTHHMKDGDKSTKFLDIRMLKEELCQQCKSQSSYNLIQLNCKGK